MSEAGPTWSMFTSYLSFVESDQGEGCASLGSSKVKKGTWMPVLAPGQFLVRAEGPSYHCG